MNILVLPAAEMQRCFRRREWSKIINRVREVREKRALLEISVEDDGCFLEPLPELEGFGTDVAISAQSLSFQVCVCLLNDTFPVQHSIWPLQKKNPGSVSM